MLFAVRHRELPSKDVVTCAVTHQDINGMSAVSTVAVKEGDGVQMSALSGYETYVWAACHVSRYVTCHEPGNTSPQVSPSPEQWLNLVNPGVELVNSWIMGTVNWFKEDFYNRPSWDYQLTSLWWLSLWMSAPCTR